MRIGLLGSGAMGRQHLDAAKGLPNVEMVTRATPPFSGIDPRDRTALLAAFLADASIDAIDICLPTPLHAPTALAALAAHKHVLCEKPLALSDEACDEVLAAAIESGRVFMVAQVLRFFPAYRHLALAARAGQFGRVVRATFLRESGIPAWAAWLTHAEESGGAILDLLVHDFDQALALCGTPARIAAEPIESVNTVRCVLEYSRGKDAAPVVVVEGGWFADARPFNMSFDVEFAEARLVLRDQRLRLFRAGASDEELLLADVNPYREQLRYFAECCAQNRAPAECPPETSAAAVRLALAARERAATAPGITTPYL